MSRKFSDQFLCSRMMLPEHREELNRRMRQMDREEKFRRPLWDEQQWEQFQLLLKEALEKGFMVEILRMKGDLYESITGTLKKADSLAGLIFVETENGIIKIKPKEVLSLQIISRTEQDDSTI